MNLTDRRAARARAAQVELIAAGPDATLGTLAALRAAGAGVASLPIGPWAVATPPPHLVMPAHHDVRPTDVLLRRLRGTLAAAADLGPRDFPELLLVPGVGARTIAALASVAEVVHGAPCRFSDPARFSLAHGGKDGHPFPVPLKAYDETITVLKEAMRRARLGNDDRLAAIRRLDAQARRLERTAVTPDFAAFVADERARSDAYGGAMVGGPARSTSSSATSRPRRAARRSSRAGGSSQLRWW